MDFSDRLRTLRKSKNLTQNELATHLNLGVTNLSRYENNSNRPDFEKLKAIADYFGVSTDFLLGYSDERLIKNLGFTTVYQQALVDWALGREVHHSEDTKEEIIEMLEVCSIIYEQLKIKGIM